MHQALPEYCESPLWTSLYCPKTQVASILSNQIKPMNSQCFPIESGVCKSILLFSGAGMPVASPQGLSVR